MRRRSTRAGMREAVALADTMIARFADPEQRRLLHHRRRPGHRLCPAQGPRRLADPVAAAPSAAFGLLRLALISGEAAL